MALAEDFLHARRSNPTLARVVQYCYDVIRHNFDDTVVVNELRRLIKFKVRNSTPIQVRQQVEGSGPKLQIPNLLGFEQWRGDIDKEKMCAHIVSRGLVAHGELTFERRQPLAVIYLIP